MSARRFVALWCEGRMLMVGLISSRYLWSAAGQETMEGLIAGHRRIQCQV